MITDLSPVSQEYDKYVGPYWRATPFVAKKTATGLAEHGNTYKQWKRFEILR